MGGREGGDSKEVIGQVEAALQQLSSLSGSCGVLSAELRKTLADLFGRLIDVHRGHPVAAESSALKAHVEGSYLNLVTLLHEEGLVRGDRGSGYCNTLQNHILDSLFSDDHLFLRYIDSSPESEVSRDLGRVMQADLRGLEELARADVAGWVGALAVDAEAEPSEPITDTGVAGPAAGAGADHPPWELTADRERLIQRFKDQPGWPSLMGELADFVRRHGCGSFQGVPAFHLDSSGDNLSLEPVADFAAFDLNWLEGNEKRVAVVERNTRNLLDGFHAHNILIYGPRGCGKSSLIRGLVSRYYSDGLRAIEIHPQQWSCLPQLYGLVRNRREFFVGVLDNISLDRKDSSSQYLASVLDGGLENQPENLVFYATSNFKDLVDREGQRPKGLSPHGTSGLDPEGAAGTGTGGLRLQQYDPQQFERLDGLRALDDRFALKVFMNSPAKSEYEQMVVSYARRAGIVVAEEELLAAFQVWRVRHNHDLIGGRTARDFILDAYPGFVRQGTASADAPANQRRSDAGLA